MKPWVLLDEATSPEGDALSLWRRDEEWVIRVNGVELMTSRAHASEDALASLALARVSASAPQVLIGGLGMGFTLAAALGASASARVTVAELSEAVIRWNAPHLLGALANDPLNDPRVTLHPGDVGALIRGQRARWDAILLDVDNGPEGLSRVNNDALYQPAMLASARVALRPGGVFGVWSVSHDAAFTRRLERAGFGVSTIPARAHGAKGRRHLIWLGQPR